MTCRGDLYGRLHDFSITYYTPNDNFYQCMIFHRQDKLSPKQGKAVEIMDMSPKQYQEYLKSINPKSPLWKNVALAFLVGGAICCLGQALSDWYRFLGLKLEDAATATSVSLVFLSALFTGLGLYHKLARHAGAGTLVPITGFANAVASPAIDFRAEGVVTGTAVKMFTVAGPVIVFGTAASAVYGLILWAVR